MSVRILWMTDRYPPARGGMAVSCARQVRGLRRRGIAVDVVAFGSPGIVEAAVEERDGGADLRIPPDSEPASGANEAWAMVRSRHRRQRYTHTVGFGAAVGGYHAVTFGAWLGARATVLVRGNDFDRDWFLPQRAAIVQETFARAAAIGTVTVEKAERIQRLYPDKDVRWAPNSVALEQWALLPSDDERRREILGLLGATTGARVIGLFGELKGKKRIPFWLEALRDRRLLDQVRLLVVGTLDAPTAAILEDPAIAPRSLRLPFRAPEELPGLYAAADFVAIPSLYEGMPNVLLEAMACGTPAIASDAGAMPEIVRNGQNGFLFACEDREAAGEATAAALALTDAELAEMSATARADVGREFSPDRELDALCELIGL